MNVRTSRDLGAALRQARRRSGLTQEALAERVGVTRQWVVAVEAGRANPQLLSLLAVTEVLGLTLDLSENGLPTVPVQQGLRRRTPPPSARRARVSQVPPSTLTEPKDVADLLRQMDEDTEADTRS
jgi:HTH-type transcriptional regulator/antitoxin HipB